MMFKVSIFIPVYYREELVKQCLASLKHTNVNEYQLDVVLNIGINGARNSFLTGFLNDYISENQGFIFSAINVFDPGENVGKGSIVNTMAFNMSDFDYLVSIDSDMELTDENWLNDMLDIFNNPNTPVKIGALCANQLNNSMHNTNNVKRFSINDMTIVCTPGNSGVSGGVLMTPASVWRDIGGYRATNIFGSDDTLYASDCHVRGLVMAYVEEVNFFHPNDTNTDYSEWKQRAKSNKLEYFDNRGFYEFRRYEK